MGLAGVLEAGVLREQMLCCEPAHVCIELRSYRLGEIDFLRREGVGGKKVSGAGCSSLGRLPRLRFVGSVLPRSG